MSDMYQKDHLHILLFPSLLIHFSVHMFRPSSRSTTARQSWTLISQNSSEFSTEPWLIRISQLRETLRPTNARTQLIRQHNYFLTKTNFLLQNLFSLLVRVHCFLPHFDHCVSVPEPFQRETEERIDEGSWKGKLFFVLFCVTDLETGNFLH